MTNQAIIYHLFRFINQPRDEPQSDLGDLSGLNIIPVICYIVGFIIVLGFYIAVFVLIGMSLKALRKSIDAGKRGNGTEFANPEPGQDQSQATLPPATTSQVH